MEQQKGFSKLLPYLGVLVIFIIVSIGFCLPAFQSKTLDQHDSKTWLWGAKEGHDYYQEKGEPALWANNMFGGMPQASIESHSPNNWYGEFFEKIQFLRDNGFINPALLFLMAMISFFVLMMVMGVNIWLAAIGSIAFAFSTYNPTIITAGHITKMYDIALLPGVIAGILLAYRGKYIYGAALAGTFLAFYFHSNHIQIIYYSLFLIAALVLAHFVEAVKTKQLKNWILGSAALVVGATFAFLSSSSKLLQMQEYSKYSTRGGGELTLDSSSNKGGGLDKEYAFSWSNGKLETLSILVPNIQGGSIGENIGAESHFGEQLSSLGANPNAIEQMTERAPLYWGPQPLLTGSVYYGAVICLLFVLAMFIIKSNYKWWIAGTALFLMLIGMGKNFSALNYFLFDHFPLFNKFRSPNMALSIPSVLFPMLGMWALKDIFEEKITKEELLKKLKLSVLITGGLCALLLVGAYVAFDYKGERDEAMAQQYGEAGPTLIKALREDRKDALAGDSLRSLVFVLLAGGALWAYAKGKGNKTVITAALGLLVVADLLPVAKRYLGEQHFRDRDEFMAETFNPRPVDAQIMKDSDPYYRVLDLTTDPFNDSKPSYFHKAIGGYAGAKMQIYQDLVTHHIGKLNSSVLNMLNTKYIISGGQNNNPVAIPNPDALGNAWFVSDINWVASANDEMQALNAPSISNPTLDSNSTHFNPNTTAVMRDTYKKELDGYTFGKDSTAAIKLLPKGYTPRRMQFEANNTQNGLAVFSDIYYPIGWKATIDGKEVPIYRVNYVLRALKVPAGNHNITFEFSSEAYKKGNTIALIGSILLSLLIATALFVYFKQKKTAQ